MKKGRIARCVPFLWLLTDHCTLYCMNFSTI